MIISKALNRSIEESKKTDTYWVERAKLNFAIGLEKQRRIGKLSYADLAKKIDTSAAYITKIFRGDSNVTIESMVKLARATGGELEIQIINVTASQVKWDASKYMHGGLPTTMRTTQGGTNVVLQTANDESFALAA